LGVTDYSSLQDLLACYRPTGAACLVLEAGLLTRAGLPLGRLRGDLGDDIPVILVSSQGTIASAVEAIRAGAADYLVKPVDPGRLWCEIQKLLAQDLLERKQRAYRIALAARLKRLTPREHEVLEGITDGLTNKRIAAAMGVSPRTVEAHRAHLMRKLEVNSLVELLRLTMGLAAG
jgi:FixJ family two-component response regulator